MYNNGTRLPPMQTQLVREELDKMLEAGIIWPVSSACSFLLVIKTMNGWKNRFCVDYLTLIQKMKGDQRPHPKMD